MSWTEDQINLFRVAAHNATIAKKHVMESLKSDSDFKESEHPRAEDGKFGSGGSSGENKKPKTEKQKNNPSGGKTIAPGSQLDDATKNGLRKSGMVGTFPPASVPKDAIKIADISRDPESLKYEALLSWDQKTSSGRISRQYRYTQEFHDRNAAEKFDRIKEILPYADSLKKKLHGEMKSGLQKSQESAAIASVILETGLRPTDNAESIKHGHYGISSLEARHVTIVGKTIHVDFIGKEGVRNQTIISDPENVQFIKNAIKDKKSTDPIFQNANSADANNTLKLCLANLGGGKNIKIKDLRTLKAYNTAIHAVTHYNGLPPPLTGNATKDVRLIQSAILKMSGEVSKVLNNTPEQARDNYIHPEIFKSWQSKLAKSI